MDTTLPPPPDLRETRATVLMIDLVRAYTGGDWDGAADLLREFDRAFRMLGDPMGGLGLHDLGQAALGEMFEQLLDDLGVRVEDVPGTIPSAALSGQLYRLLEGVELDPQVMLCLIAFCRGDLPGMLDTRGLRSIGWFIVVGLCTAVAGCVHHGGADAYLAVLDERRTAAAAA
ncbi:hypothetical protein ADK60_40320 [Streptomyces sp. XY431]|uniref:hypothetical protein n=1 Tax=Streptomyces sp. XY431 TaxID=1415562 RepID=UPI0006B023C1|nr:hypothetical protein [Streptomyces sp. XY431]KOV09622.1 hypothetical protein ADK60_40320 [Streptomyces sp. XY431]